MKVEKMTMDQFEQLKPALQRLSPGTIEIARLALVEGKKASEIAIVTGLTKQRIGAAIKQVLQKKNEIPLGWEKVTVWLPKDMVSEVLRLAESEKSKL